MQDFKQLSVWRKSHALTLQVYEISAFYPSCEMYGLTSQTRRAAASIPANIAEGCGRGGAIEMARFLRIALGSATELEYHLLLARDLTFLESEKYDAMNASIIEIKKMLCGLHKKIAPRPPSEN